jgi:hypothetical protein
VENRVVQPIKPAADNKVKHNLICLAQLHDVIFPYKLPKSCSIYIKPAVHPESSCKQAVASKLMFQLRTWRTSSQNLKPSRLIRRCQNSIQSWNKGFNWATCPATKGTRFQPQMWKNELYFTYGILAITFATTCRGVYRIIRVLSNPAPWTAEGVIDWIHLHPLCAIPKHHCYQSIKKRTLAPEPQHILIGCSVYVEQNEHSKGFRSK